MKTFGHEVLREIALRRGLTLAQIRSRRKVAPILAARIEAIARLRALGFGVAQIGRILHRDHSTISHHINPAYRERALRRARRAIAKKRAAPLLR